MVIEDISAIQSLSDLTTLNVQQNKLTSYKHLLQKKQQKHSHVYKLSLPNLEVLSIYSNQLQDKSGLQHSPKLENLYLSRTETTDLSTIPHQLFGLKVLNLLSNNLMEISYLSNFIYLQNLNIGFNKQLLNIGPLKFCTQLTELRIYYTSVSDIWPLQFLKYLKILSIDDTKVVDLHPLQYLYQLESISAYGAYIIDVSPLSNLTQLNSLILNNNKITNGETLKHHQNFSKYDFSDQIHQQIPTTDELKFYNKILKVHSSHKQIRKIMNDKKITKFKTSLVQNRATQRFISNVRQGFLTFFALKHTLKARYTFIYFVGIDVLQYYTNNNILFFHFTQNI
ncbi:leucine-rich_repeat domain-containing protein [Hexamita inflata]|uniref:Leucine-rich_repeat domain-containing protein n=1 Tax=Hexamita inflata TaxID=28002 RepID=A0ABP1GG31_9EUKA